MSPHLSGCKKTHHISLSVVLSFTLPLSFVAVQCIDVTDMKTYPATIRLIFRLIYHKQCLSRLIPTAIKHNILFNIPADTALFLPSYNIWQIKPIFILIKCTLKKNEFFSPIPPQRAAEYTVPPNEGSVYFLKWMCLINCAPKSRPALSNLLKDMHLTNHSLHFTAYPGSCAFSEIITPDQTMKSSIWPAFTLILK